MYNKKDMSIPSSLSKGDLDDSLLLRTMMQDSDDTIYFKDLHSKFILNSDTHAKQQGETCAADMYGKDDYDYFPKAFADLSYQDEQQIIQTGSPIIGRLEKLVKEDGSVCWYMASKYPLYNDRGDIIGTWGTSKDITRLKETEAALENANTKLQQMNARLESLSLRDSLSGLYNHRHFYETLTTLFKKSAERKQLSSHFSILLLDIDFFKCINDTHGHLVGDIVIRHLGELLLNEADIGDTCYRYGGDEFAIIIPDADEEKALIYGEHFRHLIASTPIVTEELTLHVTVSVGVACSIGVYSGTTLVEIADKHLYHSKKEGRNCVF